ncbi:MAG: AmmeMemoRadiSam system protein A [Acidobacteriota bacterium]
MSGLLTNGERRALLEAAREAVADAAAGRSARPLPVEGVFARRAGAFVSLHRHGELRGCIGHIGAEEPLGDVIGRCAVAAAKEDPRFDPVSPREVPDLDVEVSVLGPIEPVNDVDEIEVGRHGLIIEQQWHRGLLLPQVAMEHRWNRETFLAHACLKAGLPRDAWKHGARIFRFEAEVFGER